MRRKKRAKQLGARAGAWSFERATSRSDDTVADASFAGSYEATILRHVADRFPRLAQRFTEERQVVAAIGQARVLAMSAFIGLERLFLASHVLEEYAEVVEEPRILAAELERMAVDALGVVEPARVVKQPAEVQARFEHL